MFIAALFIIAKIWKQPMCPSIDELRECHTHSHTHTHTGVLFRHKKKRTTPCHLQQHEWTLRTLC